MSLIPAGVAIAGQPIVDTFRHGSGTTGVTGWTKLLFIDGKLSTQPVIVTEISGGFYRYEFTPDTTGNWYLDIYQTAAATVRYPARWQVSDLTSFLAGENYDSEKNSLRAISSLVQLLRHDQILRGVGYGRWTGESERKGESDVDEEAGAGSSRIGDRGNPGRLSPIAGGSPKAGRRDYRRP